MIKQITHTMCPKHFNAHMSVAQQQGNQIVITCMLDLYYDHTMHT